MVISTFPTVSRERKARVSCALRALEGQDWVWYVFSSITLCYLSHVSVRSQFETVRWDLIMDDGRRLVLLESAAADPFPQPESS